MLSVSPMPSPSSFAKQWIFPPQDIIVPTPMLTNKDPIKCAAGLIGSQRINTRLLQRETIKKGQGCHPDPFHNFHYNLERCCDPSKDSVHCLYGTRTRIQASSLTAPPNLLSLLIASHLLIKKGLVLMRYPTCSNACNDI